MTSVQTVRGVIDSAELGITLFHEHLLNDAHTAWRQPADGDIEGWEIARGPLRMEYLGRLRNDPYLSLDNTSLDDVDCAVDEIGRFVAVGGGTVVETTNAGIGRNPLGLKEIAERSGVNVVMGCGYYLDRTHPPDLLTTPIDDLADRIERDVVEGVDGIRAGVIGEIGVSPSFTPGEERSLRAAARAQARTGVPLSVHLPGWLRYGHRVLDIVEEEGANLHATVLAHMNPTHNDPDYQCSLAVRGAWIEYDMIGMELQYPGEGQSPSDAENAAAVMRLIRDGYAGSLLLSHDVFIKTLLRRYGGFGYDHILTGFIPRLEQHGVTHEVALGLLIDNPRAVFESAAEGARS
jgi:phosphotriesterase-related protein